MVKGSFIYPITYPSNAEVMEVKEVNSIKPLYNMHLGTIFLPPQGGNREVKR